MLLSFFSCLLELFNVPLSEGLYLVGSHQEHWIGFIFVRILLSPTTSSSVTIATEQY